MEVFFSAGEASGDAYAAELASRLKASFPDLKLSGVGSTLSRLAGIDLVADSSHWGVIGAVEAVGVYFRIKRGFEAAKAALARGGSGTRVLVAIDFGAMNIPLIRAAKKLGWKIVYFIPPGSWRKDRQGGDLPDLCDEIVTPFPWSQEILARMGAKVHWFGHPLKQMVQKSAAVPRERAGVAVLPGSRMHEIKHNVPAIVKALTGLGAPVHLGVSRNVVAKELCDFYESHGPGQVASAGKAHEALLSSQAAVVCSGTATLESALARCPTVVVYRGSRLMHLEYLIRRPAFEFISLPNILLGRGVLPELIQDAASPDVIRAHVQSLMPDGSEREAQLSAFDELDNVLGPADALDKSADLIASVLRG